MNNDKFLSRFTDWREKTFYMAFYWSADGKELRHLGQSSYKIGNFEIRPVTIAYSSHNREDIATVYVPNAATIYVPIQYIYDTTEDAEKAIEEDLIFRINSIKNEICDKQQYLSHLEESLYKPKKRIKHEPRF